MDSGCLTAAISAFFCFLRSNSTEYSPGKSRSLLCLPLSSAAVSCMLLPKYLLLPGDKDGFSSILGRGRGGKTVKGKTLLVSLSAQTHTHLYSDSLWQCVLLTLHPVSPHTSSSSTAAQKLSGLRTHRGPGSVRTLTAWDFEEKKALNNNVERATAALEQGRSLLPAATSSHASTADPAGCVQQPPSHPCIAAAWVCSPGQGSCLLCCVGSDASAPSPSPRWQTKGIPRALTEPVPSSELPLQLQPARGAAAAPGSVSPLCPAGTRNSAAIPRG